MNDLFEVVGSGVYDAEADTITWDEAMQDIENSRQTLMERTTAGLTVEVAYWGFNDGAELGSLTASMNGASITAFVPASKLMDAFDHPCMYLEPGDCALLGVE